jgi:hypothetical protein
MDAALSLLQSNPMAARVLEDADPDAVEFMLRMTAWQSRQLVASVFGDLPNLEPTVQRWMEHEADWASEPLAAEGIRVRAALRADAGTTMVLEQALLAYLEEVATAPVEDLVLSAGLVQMAADDVEVAVA